MKIEWRQLLIVAVVAVVFGGSAGYLGGRYSGGTADTQIESFQRFGDLDVERLERRLKCVESKAQQNQANANYALVFPETAGLRPTTFAPC